MRQKDSLQTLLDGDTLTPRRAAAHYPTLVVEVAQNNEETSSLRAKSVLYGNLDVLELAQYSISDQPYNGGAHIL